jgi:hypothetical protein
VKIVFLLSGSPVSLLKAHNKLKEARPVPRAKAIWISAPRVPFRISQLRPERSGPPLFPTCYHHESATVTNFPTFFAAKNRTCFLQYHQKKQSRRSHKHRNRGSAILFGYESISYPIRTPAFFEIEGESVRSSLPSRVFKEMEGNYFESQNFFDRLFTSLDFEGIILEYPHKSPSL